MKKLLCSLLVVVLLTTPTFALDSAIQSEENYAESVDLAGEIEFKELGEKQNPVTEEPETAYSTFSAKEQSQTLLEKQYYEPPMMVAKTNRQGLDDTAVDYSLLAKIHQTVYNFEDANQLDEFIDEYENGSKFASIVEPTGEYFAYSHSNANGYGTAIVDENGAVKQVFLDGDGSTYMLPKNSAFTDKLQRSSLSIQETEVTSIILLNYASGILFDDGSNEYFLPLGITEKSNLKTGTLYSTADIVADIKANAESLTAKPEAVETINDDYGRPMIPVGGSGGNTVSSDVSGYALPFLILFGGLTLVIYLVFRHNKSIA